MAQNLSREISFGNQAGIALGHVLLIIAFLAVIAAIIVAVEKSGHASDPTNIEDNKKASVILQIGDNLKTGIDRLFMENKIPFASVDTNTAHTSGSNQLFSPTAGGITPPSWSMADDPSTDGTSATGDIWYFPRGAVPGLGTSAPELLAVLKVSQGVCNEIDIRALGQPTPAASNLGNFYSPANDTALLDAWPAGFKGRTVGCVQNKNAASNGYFFFEVLAIQ